MKLVLTPFLTTEIIERIQKINLIAPMMLTRNLIKKKKMKLKKIHKKLYKITKMNKKKKLNQKIN